MKKMIRSLNIGLKSTTLLNKNKILNTNNSKLIFDRYYNTLKYSPFLQNIPEQNVIFRRKKTEEQVFRNAFNRSSKKININNNFNVYNKNKDKVPYNKEGNKQSEKFANYKCEIFSYDPWDYYKDLVTRNKISINDSDGTFDASEFVKGFSKQAYNTLIHAIDFFMDIEQPKNIRNILKKISPSSTIEWNGHIVYTYLRGLSYLKYDFNEPIDDFRDFLETLENKISLAPIEETKDDLTNIKNCIYHGQISLNNNGNYTSSRDYFNIFIKEALFQGLLCSMEKMIKEKFDNNIWDHPKIFRHILFNSNKQDALGFVLKSACHLNRYLKKNEVKILHYIAGQLKNECICSVEKVNNAGITDCGEKLMTNYNIDENQIKHLLDISIKHISDQEVGYRNGYTIENLKSHFSMIKGLKNNKLKEDSSKNYIAVVDGLNIFHNNVSPEFLYKWFASIKNNFSNCVIVTRPFKKRNNYFNILKNKGFFFMFVPQYCNDDFFIINTTLAFGEKAFLISNDLYRDYEDSVISDAEDKKLFRKWMDIRNVKWSHYQNPIKIPPNYLKVVQGNFENFQTPFKIHFPIYYERGSNLNFPVEKWYCLRNKNDCNK